MAGNTVLSDDEDEVGPLDDEREPHEADRSRARVDDEDEDEEDEDGQDFYEKDGFIVDDEEEEQEEEEESDEERRKKKKRKKRESEKNYTLDEDDYELLEDNNIPGFHRLKAESKKFKRLKKAQRSNEEGHSEFYDEEEYDGSGKGGRTAEEKLKHSLFGDDEGQQLEDIGEYDERPEEGEDADMGDDDEMADFIVEDDDDGHGAVVSRKKPNKKSRLGAPGVTSSAIQEAQDIFGDVDELLDRRKQGLDSGELKERRLVDEFEPIVLSEKYMTEKDDRIREIDIPERMQISEESTGPPPTDDITSVAEESSWINSQLATTMECLSGKTGTQTADKDHNLSITNDDVMRFLEFMHTQKLDVPFIAMYRKEEIQSLLKDTEQEEGDEENQDKFVKTPKLKCHKMLWVIQDLDRKWLQLQKRKNALRLYYQKRSEEETQTMYDETRLNLNRQLFESILNSLKTAESEKEVDDVDSKFNLHFPPGEVGLEEGQFKRPKRKSQYSICSKQGLWEVASKFGYSSEQFGSHISLANVSEELEDAKETPEEMASKFTCAMFETPQAVLKGARHMAAVEISYEPSVRKHVRSTFMDNAELTTIPTADGKLVIDSFHQFAGVKWLCNKPLTTIKDAQWLLIQKAEEEKLLKVTIKLPEASLNKLISDFNENYLSDGVSKSAQLWNEQRKQILEDAIYNFLLPAMEKESRSLLTTRAKMWLLSEYGKVLLDKVSVAPYQRKESDVNSDDEAAPKVMACCWGSGNPATTFVMLDSSGEVLDVLYTGSLTVRSQNVNDQQRKKNDQQRVKKFMTDHQPHVVVLGAANLYCPRLRDDIYEIIFKMVEDDPRDVDPEMDGISVVYGDESIPRLYENSRISSDQLPTQKGNVKRAVALGRYLQNPLAMITTLCGPGREITSWKLHSLDSFLTPDEKFGMVEQVLVDVTNQVGLDINLAASHEWLFAPLQFIAGLGPRKAASLQRSLVRTGTIFTRKDFVTSHGLGKKVFVNAVGFLRVRRSGVAGTSNQYIDLLDDTRIHPESYGLAQQLAKDIYKEQIGGGVNDDDDDEDEMEMAIEHVRDNPSSLKSINLRLYLEQKKRLNKRDTFHDILLELIHGFQDRRKPYEEPSQDVEFYMISGETEDTLAEGRVVQATVRRVLGSKAFCSLDSGLTGILANFDYSDKLPGKSGGSSEAVDLTEKLSEGDLLTCTIKSIQKNRYQVDLCCKEGETKNNRYQNLDPFYREDQKTFDEEKEKARKDKELAKKYFKPRMIVHPRFQNITIDEATELLSDKEPGESIIRPSSRGPSFLTLTLKVYDSVYAHKDIVEGGKEHKDITSLLRIGKTLKIGEDTFEDLDEVMDRYVDPLVTHLKAMLCYRKFKKGSKAEVDELLKIEKAEFPLRIVYCFGISHEHPGTFILTYIRSSNPHHEYIGLYPKGFKFRKRMFEDIDRLVSYFQRHIDDPPQESALSMRSVAAMVPLRSPATGGSSGAGSWGGSASNNEGGWRDRSATPGSRPGRGDYRNSGRDGNSSGIPRPYGGRGRGRGSGDHTDSDYGTPKWGSGSKKGDDGLSSFPGAKVRNSPGKEAFPGGWGSGGDGASGGGGGSWGGGSGGASGGGGWGGAAGSSGWGSGGGAGDADAGNSGWGNSGGSGSNKNLSQAPSHNGWSGGGGGW